MSIKQLPQDIAQSLNTALNYHKTGKFGQAGQLYREILAIDPNNIEANHYLGILAHQTNDYELAIQLIRKVITLVPGHAKAHNNLGNIISQQGDLEEGVRCYKQAISFNTQFFEAYNNLGVALHKQNKLDEAIVHFQKAISLKYDYAEAIMNLGVTYKEQSRIKEAIECFHKTISLKPDSAEAHNNLGTVFSEDDNFEKAILSYKKAISLNPHFVEAHNNLGGALKDIGKLDAALVHFKKAISLNPHFAEAYNNLGIALSNAGKLDAALSNLKKAISLSPHFAEAHNNLGNAYKELGLLQNAIASLQNAIKLKPDYAEAHNNIGSAYKHRGDCEKSITFLQKALQLKSNFNTCHSNLLLTLNYTSTTQKEIFDESRRWSSTYSLNGQEIKEHSQKIHNNKIKVGYISPDFKNHSVAYFFEPLIRQHNKNEFEIFCYSNVHKPDAVTARIKTLADHWVSLIGKNTSDIVNHIQDDQINILVDLAGHTANNSMLVFSQKPAPIQVTWLGYPNTTGLDTIDYRFTDSIADPASSDDELYSEELYRLENGFLCYQAEKSSPDLLDYPCFDRSFITFGSFNNLTKITSEVINTWAEILAAEPGSHLLLKSIQLADEQLCSHIKQRFVELGVSSERVELYGKLPSTADHLKLYSKVDIGLDPFPYNGTTTTFEALWMGVPIITLRGYRHSGRVGASIMHHLGCPELIAESKEDYIQKAIGLAQDLGRIKEYHQNLRVQLAKSPLCNAGDFAVKIEIAYHSMWKRWKEKKLRNT